MILVCLVVLVVGCNGAELNNRPIIGVLSQEISKTIEDLAPEGTYIAASYVKWVEAAGARVVPIVAGSSQNLTQLFGSINGLLIPGGAASIADSKYERSGKEIFELAKAANDDGDVFPIWATCLGFELMAYLTNDEQRNLARCSSVKAYPLYNIQTDNRLFGEADAEILDILSSQNVTANSHHWCLTMDNFTKFEMNKFWKEPLSLNYDEDGFEFISTLEAKDYPFYGTQFHPEKNNFEWSQLYSEIPHTQEAVKVSNYFANFFVSEARKSTHRFASRADEDASLIYNYSPHFTGSKETDWAFQQAYVFQKEA